MARLLPRVWLPLPGLRAEGPGGTAVTVSCSKCGEAHAHVRALLEHWADAHGGVPVPAPITWPARPAGIPHRAVPR